jgi:glycosyltransferase involved in cell wall biosynthesis
MHIAIDARMAVEPLSGPGRYAINLIRGLTSLDRENQYLILQNSRFLKRITEAKNFKTIWVDYPPLSLRGIFLLRNLLWREKIDIFHSLYFLLPLRVRALRIITLHDIAAIKFPNFFQGRRFFIKIYAGLFTKVFTVLSATYSNRIITVSRTAKKDIVQWKPKFKEKVEVIYEAVDPIFKNISNPKVIQKVKNEFKLSKKVILYIGSTRPYKNLPRLIKAFNLLCRENDNCYQLVIGVNDSRNISLLRKLTKRYGLIDSTVFINNLTDEEIVALMNVAEIFVFPSLTESFGLPPLEAMACGTPVITSNAGSLPEVVGDAALLVNPENVEDIASAIETVLTNKKLRKELIKKGFERVKTFSWEKTAKETLEVYESVLGVEK